MGGFHKQDWLLFVFILKKNPRFSCPGPAEAANVGSCTGVGDESTTCPTFTQALGAASLVA